ncbi:SARDH [Lepeophtheirus salmonis]|uniref:SARDH n=1 Tax=Lepeophtheirus salmonis TaxID=72036 RepID=A0A7R8D0M4_LEPSM|nr:SARDH [Lepeophtheirus salmonis]CAF2986118.1 SARDH [Lepeophtheirus salmonis]
MFCRCSKFFHHRRQSKIKFHGNRSYSTPNNEVKKEADGGGSIGCQTAYHLAKRGVTNVVLLEKNKLTSGTTWHTAGLLWNLRNSDVDNQLIHHSAKVFKSLESETGVSTGWINNGGLFIANNKQRLDEYKRMHTLGRATGAEIIYYFSYGYKNNLSTIETLSRYCVNNGIQIFEDTSVVDILTEETSLSGRKIKGVKTSNGFIKTENVVNCTGGWANYISRMVGIETPLVVMKHAYVTTDRIEGIERYPNIRDHDLSIYLKLQGDALHIGGYENNPIILDKLDEEFSFGLYDLDWDVFGIHLENAIERLPALEMVGIKSTICGPESFTPDHKPIMGEDPRVRGYFHGNGFNSAGMMFGGGCGDQLAAWIINGRPELDMYSFDIRRFCPETTKYSKWVVERSHEAYVKNYANVFVHDQPLAGRNIKKDPFHDVLEADGCFFEERFGWERPGWFYDEPTTVRKYDYYGAYGKEKECDYSYIQHLEKDYTYDFPDNHNEIRNECWAARNTAALFNMTYFGKFYLFGPDAREAANWIFSQNLDSSPTNKVIYSCMLNKDAKIEADLTVSPLHSSIHFGPKFQGEGFYIVTSGGSADISRNIGILSLQGPFSRDILKIASNNEDDWTNESFPVSSQKEIDIQGIKVRALRVSFVGEMGWELHIPNKDCVQIYNILHETGKKFGMVNAGFRALDSLSIEKGYPHWHQEIRMDDSPIEAGLLFSCKLNSDTDFLGKTKLVEEKKLGAPLKRKCCFTLDESPEVFLLGNEAIIRNGEVVGFIRRADFAFHLGCPIAYGYVKNSNDKKVTIKWLKEGSYENERIKGLYGTAEGDQPTDTGAVIL